MAKITQGWNLAIGCPTGDTLRACDERTSGEMGSESPLGVGSRDNGMGEMTRTLARLDFRLPALTFKVPAVLSVFFYRVLYQDSLV